MLNYLWAGMMITGILWGALHGQLSAVTEGALQSSKEAVTLCITMLGVMSLWTGVLESAIGPAWWTSWPEGCPLSCPSFFRVLPRKAGPGNRLP